MAKLFAVFVLTLCMATATLGVICYTCSSTKSAEDCEQQQKPQACVSIYDQCITSFITYKTGSGVSTANTKSCGDKDLCDMTLDTCRNHNKGNSGNCTFAGCCYTDYCNSGDGPTSQPNKCYTCSSEKSWEDCDNAKKEKICPPDQQGSCGTAVLQGNKDGQAVKRYVKDCVATSLCHPDNCKLYDPSLKDVTCDLQCCTGDLCNTSNGAKVPMVSAVILLTCALIAKLG